MKPIAVGIYAFDDMEVLDFTGPFEVFTTANRVSQRLFPQHTQPFHVFSISEKQTYICARAGLRILSDFDFQNHPAIHLLIIPGGVIQHELKKQHVIDWVRQQATQTHITASVCTGVFILAQAQVLTQETVTTHWEDIHQLADMFPLLQVKQGARWIDQGKIITSAGIAAGIDMCLYLVSKLISVELAIATARQMDYSWQQDAP